MNRNETFKEKRKPGLQDKESDRYNTRNKISNRLK